MDRVGIIRCDNYKPRSMSEAFDKLLENQNEKILSGSSGKKVLIKLNLLFPAEPHRAITTHPALLEQVIRRLSDNGAMVLVGDSPGGTITDAKLRKCWKICGIEDICNYYGAKIVSFENESIVKSCPDGLIREFNLPALIQEVDSIIGIGKLKTHQYMAMTAAVKLHFGFIPGLGKPALHMRIPEREKFARMLVELCNLIDPDYSIIDGIEAMEGDGPAGGNPKHVGILAGSRSPYALDYILSKIIGFGDPLEVPTIQAAKELNLFSPDNIDVYGEELEQSIVTDFKRVPRDPYDMLPAWMWKYMRTFAMASPELIQENCKGCGRCVESCPMDTMAMKNGKPVFYLGNCIRCFCCQEMCEFKAIRVRRGLIARVFHRFTGF